MKNKISFLLIAVLLSGSAVYAAQPVVQQIAQALPAADPAPAIAHADAAIANPALKDYHGWLKYLEFRVRADAERHGAQSPDAVAAIERLEEWTAKIEADPQLLGKLRGVQEWAYESAADGSGQPFKLNIPTDYDPSRPMPLSLYAHGYSGNHLEHSTGWTDKTGSFDLGVLGRARGGFYFALSEADVMDTLKYVRAHWNIDPYRIHLNGGSMGGMASYRLGARYPDIWASIAPDCGMAAHVPMENLLTVPVYALHSIDDPVVSISLDNGALERLRKAGGCVITEEPNGFGHGVWNFVEGNARAGEWAGNQVRPAARDVRRLDYTAVDGIARGAWWAKVTSWGPQPRPAHFLLNAGTDNTLYATLDNISTLRLDLANSPFSRERDLRISVNGAKTFTIPAPLAASVEIARGANGWEAVDVRAPALRREHTPGGAVLLYDGSPLLIVYGTQGDEKTNATLLAAATAASRSPNPIWHTDDIDRAPQDGVSHYQNLYGSLPMKADRDVSAADLGRCNLVIIGSAAQNSLAARIAAELPVKIENGRIECGEAGSYESKDNALGLVYYSPFAADRLVLWLASESADFYRPGAFLPVLLAYSAGIDLAIMNVSQVRIVAARSFGPDWKWSCAQAQSPLLPAAASTDAGWAALVAGILRDATKADFAVAVRPYESLGVKNPALCATKGITRYADMAAIYYYDPVYVLELTGAQLADMAAKRAAFKVCPYDFSEGFDSAKLVPERLYSVAMLEEDAWAILDTGFLPHISHYAGIEAADAILKAGK
jgi:pimeloyl-ACP methyl ester carboxylesterase